MKLGLQVPNFTWPDGHTKLGENLLKIARNAEDAGFYSFWVMDHFFQIEFVGPAEMDMLEGWSTLGFVAAATKTIKLGTMVTGITYRRPAILVKTATTVDVLSAGRSYFGIGAAWFEREHKALGVPFPRLSDRFERLEETIQIALQMWSPENGPYQGKHYHLAETLCVPQPVSQPHPPILIGGMGENKTLRLVAKYAQGCNLFEFAGHDVLKHKLTVLKEHCLREGRSYGDIEKTTLGVAALSKSGAKGTQSPTQFLERLHALAEMGIDQAIVSLADPLDEKAWEMLATEVVPKVGGLAVAHR